MATEVGRFNSDFLVVNDGALHELEIKTSRPDFLADFRKKKHLIYESGRSYWTPNQFYFVVPEELLEFATAKCIDKKYGVMVVKEPRGLVKSRYYSKDYDGAIKKSQYLINRNPEFSLLEVLETDRCCYAVMGREDFIPWKDRVKIVKRAKSLHTRIPDQRVLDTIIARLSSEMSGLRESEYNLIESKGK